MDAADTRLLGFALSEIPLDRALLIRKSSLEGRDLTDLLQSNGDGSGTNGAAADTTQIPLETEDYRIFPGNLVPEGR